MTRFSVLVPTRNGGRLLRTCLDAVLSQQEVDLEIVVSDNANTDETPAVLADFADDPRVVALRHEQPLSVTDNWSAALDAASGEYILMIGDDDLLLPGCLAALNAVLGDRGQPECLTFNAVRYIAHDALEGVPSSWYAAPYFNFDDRVRGQAHLSHELRRELVAELFEFRFRFPLTMQLTLVSRRAIGRLRQGLFRSPFPDHYGIGALLLTADSWGFWQGMPLIVGVSHKSFGQYFFNRRDISGLGYLGVTPTFKGRLPGSEVANATAAWLLELHRDFGDHLDGVRLSRAAYVGRHLLAWVRDFRFGRLSSRDLWERLNLLSPRDVVGLIGLAGQSETRHDVREALVRLGKARGRTDPLWAAMHQLEGINDIASFASWWMEHGRRVEDPADRAEKAATVPSHSPSIEMSHREGPV